MRSNHDRPLAVDVPRGSEDHPAWIKVGMIAAVGFAIGVVWPRLAGVRLGPSAPGESANASASASAPAPRGSEPSTVSTPVVLATASAAASAAVPTPTPAPAPAAGPAHVTVSKGTVLSCKSSDGEAMKGQSACGALAIDSLIQPRIRRLKDCSAADGAAGKLSVLFGVDFTNNRLNVDVGKSSTVPNSESIAGCLKREFGGVSLGTIDHEHPRYTVSYNATLSAGDGAAAATTAGTSGTTAPPAPTAAEAPTSTVVWEVAIVRDSPRTGQVIGRLQRGTKVKVGQGQENWYRVRYGNGFSNEGWVYRGAIGK